ncbi:MAG: LysR family transcriptional regulator [Bosea sp. (in: a-proteobacteria)]
MDIRWLQDFLTVAETGNFTRAAERRNASQAAFSRRIQSLEAWVGAALIDRGIHPARLTPAGEQFRQHAASIVRATMDARSDIAGDPEARREHVRVALPYALATSQFAQWWPRWSQSRKLSCSVVLGNIDDLVTSLMSDSVDLMLCFESVQQPVYLDPEGFERLHVVEDRLVPYASRELMSRQHFALPGRADKPLPLLLYTPGVYLARLVEMMLESSNGHVIGSRVIESDMSDVLRDLAAAGHGIAWLPASSVGPAWQGLLQALPGTPWSMPLNVIAFRRKGNRRAAVERVWAELERNRPGVAR